MMFFADDYQIMVPFFISVLRIGVGGVFALVYLANVDVFPTLFTGSALGICNFFARISNILSP